ICATSDPNLLRLLFASHQQNRRLRKHYLQAIGKMSEFILQAVGQGGVARAEFSTDVTFSQWFCFLINACSSLQSLLCLLVYIQGNLGDFDANILPAYPLNHFAYPWFGNQGTGGIPSKEEDTEIQGMAVRLGRNWAGTGPELGQNWAGTGSEVGLTG